MSSPPGASPLLLCSNLLVGYGKKPLLPPIDLTVQPGTVLAILGRNGSGKSTLIKTLLGFLRPVGGRIVLPTPPPKMAYLAQASSLDGLIPVRAREVVAWGLESRWSFLGPRSGRGLRRSADLVLEEVGALGLRDRFVRDLSEGQKQRVQLGRVIAAQADLVFLDEPTAAMDAVAEQHTLALLRAHSRKRGMAVILVTHLIGLIRRYADQVLFLDRDDGVALAAEPGVVFEHPTFRRQYGELGPAKHAEM